MNRYTKTNMHRLLLSLAAIALCNCATAIAGDEPPIEWRPWSDSVFVEAKNDHRFILLDLGTVWCHWCHVMDEVTYQDAEVVKLARERYINVRVDADARPDLADRYEDYGWPATIVFNAEGGEIVKRRGYLPPRQMASMLQAIIDDPTPGPSVVQEAPFAAGTKSTLGDDTQSDWNRWLAKPSPPSCS
jgi:thioredoxin-related protein